MNGVTSHVDEVHRNIRVLKAGIVEGQDIIACIGGKNQRLLDCVRSKFEAIEFGVG